MPVSHILFSPLVHRCADILSKSCSAFDSNDHFKRFRDFKCPPPDFPTVHPLTYKVFAAQVHHSARHAEECSNVQAH